MAPGLFIVYLHHNNHNMKEYKNKIEVALRNLGAGAQLATSMTNSNIGFVESSFEKQRPPVAVAQSLWNIHQQKVNR